MKKTIGLILFILVMIFTVGSFAEQAPADTQNVQTIDAMGAFKVSAQIPEGYRFSGTYASDILYVGYLTPQNPLRMWKQNLANPSQITSSIFTIH